MSFHCPLDSVTTIQISGKDRLKWLNNLVTNDVLQTTDQRSVECFVTDVKGRTLSHGIVVPDGDLLCYFSWGKNQASRLIPHWDRYIIREDVALADVSDQWDWSLIHRDAIRSYFGPHAVPSAENRAVVSIDGTEGLLVVNHSLIGQAWCLVRCSSHRVHPWLPEAVSSDSAANDPNAFAVESVRVQPSIPSVLLEQLRIQHRWPIVGIDFDEKNLPQELDRNHSAISFNKGCYLGQETVARLDALGQVQKKLLLVSIDSAASEAPSPIVHGSKLTCQGQEAGMITSVACSPEPGRLLALAYVRRPFFAAGTLLDCQGSPTVVQPASPSNVDGKIV